MADRLLAVESVHGDYLSLTGGVGLYLNASEVSIGVGVEVSPALVVGTRERKVKRFVVGDHSRIYAGQIMTRDFICGDYTTIHEGLWAYGRESMTLGHNFWAGRRVTLDAEGRFYCGNGVGAGQDTHLWSHIRHGDTVAGCRFLSFGEFYAEDDVWFVGRCTSAPVYHERFSIAMTESNLTKGMKQNTIWGGNPAKDLTDRIGRPYEDLAPSERLARFSDKVDAFLRANPDVSRETLEPISNTFNVTSRTYRKTNDPIEVRFMRFLLPEAKFVPENQWFVSL